MSQQQTIQVIIFLLVAGSGILRYVFQKLQEQAAEKRKVDDQERRRLEILRTGRDPGRPQPAPISADPSRRQAEVTQRQREEAARRQAQIEEFRRRQMDRARQRGDAARPLPQVPPTRPITPRPPLILVPGTIPGSTGPTVPPTAPRRPSSPPPRPQPRKPARAQPPPSTPPAPQPAARAAPPKQPSAAAAAPAPSVPATAETLRLAAPPRTAEEWRRAIVLNEILSPPVSDRPEGIPSPF